MRENPRTNAPPLTPLIHRRRLSIHRRTSTTVALLIATIMGIATSMSILSYSTRQHRGDGERDDERVATSIAAALAASCPIGDDPSSEAARDVCADKLTNLAVLSSAMIEPFIWGGQTARGYALDKGTNKFNPRVWRRLYLSTFMFGTACTIERTGDRVVLHVPVRFRGAMPPGAYPYPFWHKPAKWDAYSYATTIHFVLEHGKLIGALRGTEQDRTRPRTAHAWDGQWGQPRVSLYSYLLSRENPHLPALDEAYRALEVGLRQHNCQTCHAPDNQAHADQLEFFVYPNQALTGRHDIIAQLEDDTMPPANELGIAPGIADPQERAQLIDLARTFESAGDAALDWEDTIVRGPARGPMLVN